MQAWYGPYALPVNGADVRTVIRASGFGIDGKPLTYIHTVTLDGCLDGSTQAECSAAEAAFRAAFSRPDLDFVFKMDNGAATPTKLIAATSIVGVQVLAMAFPLSYGGAEYATARGFSLTLQAEYDVQRADQIVAWDESLTIVGNGGPRRVVREVVQGEPVEQETAEKTPVRATQTGQAVGLFSYPTPPAPLFGRDKLMNPDVAVSYSTPQVQGRRPMRYAVTWNYQFQSATPLTGTPKKAPTRV